MFFSNVQVPENREEYVQNLAQSAGAVEYTDCTSAEG